MSPGRTPGSITTLFTRTGLPPLPAAASPAFTVAVLDTGVTLVDGRPHPYLEGHLTERSLTEVDTTGRTLAGEDAAGASVVPEDGHGTVVAGVVLRHAPTATVDARNVVDGSAEGRDTRVAAALDALGPDVRLVNLSFYGRDDTIAPEGIREALGRFLDAHPDALVVIAAGNRMTDAPVFPGAFSRDFARVKAIGAVDTSFPLPDGRTVPPRAAFSSHGDWLSAYAPGVLVRGPRAWFHEDWTGDDRRHGWALSSGTSFAAPQVTGRLAQIMIDDRCPAVEAWERLTGGAPTLDGVPVLTDPP